jgi:hypothetical protein
MRTHLKVSAILVAALLMSTMNVVAQTGEFASPVPGAVVHEGYALQDWWQNERNARVANPPAAAAVQPPRAETILVKPKRVPPKYPQ